MRKILFIIALFLTAIVMAQPLTTAQAQAFKKEVLAKNKAVQTMQADFIQKKHLDFMSKDIETFGKMAFAKPDKFNWQYTQPYQYRIVFQKDHIQLNDAGKVSNLKADNKVFKKINHLIVSTVSGEMFDEQSFKIEFYKVQAFTQLRLLPKDKTLLKFIGEIHLFFAADYTVERVKLIEPNNDYTEIFFSNKKLNTSLDESHFKM